ncbi:MAG: NAD(P)H-dependent oxidoreductase subunit E [Bacteroidota bacterium]
MAVIKKPLQKTFLMNVLWDIQKKRRFISRDDMTKIAEEFDISRMELEGVISFYHFFHRTHSGKYTIYLNKSVVSSHKNYKLVKKAFENEVGVKFGNVTDNKMFGLFVAPCIGLSDQESSALINFNAFTDLTPKKVKIIISKLKKGESLDSFSKLPKNNIQYIPDVDRTIFFKKYSPGIALKKLKKISPDQVIDLVKKSNLAGRGGAFFPTGLKWQYCKNNKSDQKYIICNADEGEPGTFKDRVLMNKLPGLLIEGMTMAAYAVGATKGAIYLRAEYFYLKEKLENKIEEFKAKGLLGKDILGIKNFDFDIYIHMGAGAYICGEETALISSMEGKRGEPTIKEFFPVEKGFLGKPTIVNNVETLCAVPRIFEMGVEKWLSLGTEKTPGTKLLSVSGDCKKPGVYEIEWGMKVSDLLKMIGAENPKMVQFSGPSGYCLSKEDFNRSIRGEDLICCGSVMVFNKDRDILDILKCYSDFFVSESCGICVPCRVGNYLLNKKLKKLILGHADQIDLKAIKDWGNIIKRTSRCGLGQTSSNSLLCAMEKFSDDFQKRLTGDGDINKAFNIDNAIKEYDTIIDEIETTYG